MSNRIKAARLDADLTQGQLGRLIGLSQQQVAKLESGRHKLSSEMAVTIAKALNIRLEDVLGVAERAQVPIIGTLGASDMVYCHPPGEEVRMLDAPPLSSPGMVAVEVIGDIHYPAYRAGDILFCAPAEPPGAVIGEECAVTLEDGRMLLKRILPGHEPGTFILVGVVGPEVVEARVRDCRRVEYIRRARRRRTH